MKFNVSKCHSMRVTRLHPSRHIDFNYTLHQQTLEQVQSAKYLGLTITDDLDWGQHISEITCKATKTLGFLRRNLALAPRHTKEVAYKTLVRPQLEYAAPIWHPYHETQIEMVEKVQRTAARWTCRRWRNTSSVGEMLDELEWPSLESRRERSSLTFFYKIHSGTVSLDKDKYLTPAPNLRHTRASHESQYTRPFAYSDALKNSFFPRTIPVWNSLPSSVVLSKTIEEFKDNLSDILVFNLGNVPGFHLIRAKVGGIFKLKFHTTYRNMIIYSSRLDTQNPDVTVQRISTFKHVQAHVLIYLWFRNV